MNTLAAKAVNTTYLSISESAFSNELQTPEVGFIDRSGVFVVRDNAHFSFHVSTPFSQHFALIKGLIEFHRPKALSFTFDRVGHRIEARVVREQVTVLTQFLQSVNEWLLQELRFKRSLKTVLEFENRYRQEQDAVYKELALAVTGAETIKGKFTI